MSYVHLKCIIVISKHAYFVLQVNFCAISFNGTQNLHFSNNSRKTVAAVPPSKLCSQKLYEYHLAKYVYCVQNFVRFHALKSEIEYHKNFGKNGIAAPPTELYEPKLHHFYF